MSNHLTFRLSGFELGWSSLQWQGLTLLQFESSGSVARVGEGVQHFPQPSILRWGAPVALAATGHVLLHASAVRRDETTVALIGVGGAGKSTIARQLVSLGWEPVSDDVVACNAAGEINLLGEGIVRNWCASFEGALEVGSRVDYGRLSERLSRPRNQQWRHLHRILFLPETRSDSRRFLTAPLTQFQCLQNLIRYGFEGMPTPAVRVHHLRTYCGLARLSRADSLEVPNGLQPMREAVPDFSSQILARPAAQADDPGDDPGPGKEEGWATLPTGAAAARLDGQLVLLRPEDGAYFQLDEIGARVLQELVSGGSTESICETLLQEYEADRNQLRRDVEHLTLQLSRQGLVGNVSGESARL